MRRSAVTGASMLALWMTLGAGTVWAGPAAGGAPAQPAPSVAPTQQERTQAPVVSDGPVTVTTRLSPDPSNIGDILVLEVVAAFPRNVRVNLPTRLNFEPLRRVGTEEGEPEPTGDGLRKTFRIELQYFEVGPATIPGFPLTYVDADGNVRSIDVPPRPFTVESLLANETEPPRRGEDPPISREYPDTTSEIVIWSALATLLLAIVGWILVRRFWRRDRGVALPPPIPPHEVAIEALADLERGELLAHGEVQRYYLELTEIAKGYIEGRFGVDALDRTTEEIRRAVLADSKRLEPLSPDDVIEFLQHCDLVKFARFAPPEDEAREALGSVREMVHASIPTEKTPPKSEGEQGNDGGQDDADSGQDDADGPDNDAREGSDGRPDNDAREGSDGRPDHAEGEPPHGSGDDAGHQSERGEGNERGEDDAAARLTTGGQADPAPHDAKPTTAASDAVGSDAADVLSREPVAIARPTPRDDALAPDTERAPSPSQAEAPSPAPQDPSSTTAPSKEGDVP